MKRELQQPQHSFRSKNIQILDLKKLTHISCSIAALYTEACSIQILISAHIGSIDTSSIISFKLNHMI